MYEAALGAIRQQLVSLNQCCPPGAATVFQDLEDRDFTPRALLVYLRQKSTKKKKLLAVVCLAFCTHLYEEGIRWGLYRLLEDWFQLMLGKEKQVRERESLDKKSKD